MLYCYQFNYLPLKDAVVSRDSPTAGIHVHELSPSSTLNEEDLQHVAGNQLDYYPFQNEGKYILHILVVCFLKKIVVVL